LKKMSEDAAAAAAAADPASDALDSPIEDKAATAD
jgi:hypothetical protein